MSLFICALVALLGWLMCQTAYYISSPGSQVRRLAGYAAVGLLALTFILFAAVALCSPPGAGRFM